MELPHQPRLFNIQPRISYPSKGWLRYTALYQGCGAKVKLWSALPESASDLSEEACDSEGLSVHTSRLRTRGWDLEKTAPLLLEIVVLKQVATSNGSRRETLDENGARGVTEME